jgi:hypothetical protein
VASGASRPATTRFVAFMSYSLCRCPSSFVWQASRFPACFAGGLGRCPHAVGRRSILFYRTRLAVFSQVTVTWLSGRARPSPTAGRMQEGHERIVRRVASKTRGHDISASCSRTLAESAQGAAQIDRSVTRPRRRGDGDQLGSAALQALAGRSPPMRLKGWGCVPWSSRSAWVRR